LKQSVAATSLVDGLAPKASELQLQLLPQPVWMACLIAIQTGNQSVTLSNQWLVASLQIA